MNLTEIARAYYLHRAMVRTQLTANELVLRDRMRRLMARHRRAQRQSESPNIWLAGATLALSMILPLMVIGYTAVVIVNRVCRMLP